MWKIESFLLSKLFLCIALCTAYVAFSSAMMEPGLWLLSRPIVPLNRTSTVFGLTIVAIGLSALSSWLSKLTLNNFTSDDSWDWSQEIVVVTGASSGIGAEIVRLLAELSIKTFILDPVPPDNSVLKNGSVHYYKVDITKPKEVSAAAREIQVKFSSPTVLINNAGVGLAKNLLDENETERRHLMNVNLLSQFTTVQEFLPAMIEKNHGHIVTMASSASYISSPQIVSYAASKAALVGFHEGLGIELVKRYNAKKIRTTLVFAPLL
ncbi:hypothetical protein COCC4DRAFT_155544 [Bipolaris maydis ATCC 48331]|uniref:Dehydrogenase RED2 n=1 Tax=Cochliobolus heterostrophus (strain C4 / ATCC 48331 / race T) TaxID=665024 RepID=RED2_COCH4|nr:uncharacterized protein COCC4DRAFT_155544 [Bipolaris maydis ATCC 48331]N4WE43.1 RecName: Full=Dehydrogenase RED2; AltName: Full=T-toxin biosynthesis protein RED2 [Bipolaris maydis ATCC 48331]ACP34152.1 putative short chain dehydrogenase [Bipolaris maydis]ENH98523.1 hypothetical protein COCC4DRAFT_155544 [Bipolaris maydis ATCC 48331]KAJ5026272.1 hypothetical protein J3E73DRAFT_391506 [Bipolaris maydis]KAJ5051354.1 putative short chain dehydrogenase [Bipolaris maydis]KAJ6196398.1 putative sh